mmetsp:Transcript_18996/g.52339  ORF Transcript_18996/g.52339 Transcript_18996/m.52339 type:complete len:214 (+) Transcript_18996:225-866(+)
MLNKAHVALVEERCEDKDKPCDLRHGNPVPIGDVGDRDGHHLSDVHRRGEDQRSKLFDLRVNEELASNCGCTQHRCVGHEPAMSPAEAQSGAESVGAGECDHRDEGGKQIDIQHLVVLRGVVLSEKLFLHCGGKAIQCEEGCEPQETPNTVPTVDRRCHRTGHDELRDAQGHSHGDKPVPGAVVLPRDVGAPSHDGHHLEAFPEHLQREGDVL